MLFTDGFSQSLPADRQLDWSIAGLENTGVDYSNVVAAADFGAIPGDSLDDAWAIAAAIASLTGPGIVNLGEGIYDIQSTINLPSWVILRGTSSAQTLLRCDLGGLDADCFSARGTVTGDYDTLQGGFEQDSRFVQVTDPSAFTVGSHVEIVEDNGAWDTSPATWASESLGQLTEVVGISGDTLELADPLRISYSAPLSPRLRTYQPVEGAGLECMALERVDDVSTGVAYMTYWGHAVNCWVAGVESRKSVGSHVMIAASKHILVSGCYFYDSWAFNGVSTRGYGVTLIRHSGDCLIENNVFEHLRHAMMVKQGANGNVFSYNYSIDPFRSEPGANFSGDISLHGHYPYGNLFEGNIIQNIMTDDYWGPSGPRNTFFRNRVEMFGVVMTSDSSNRQAYMGNEITSTLALQGNYVLSGTDHFEAGNYVQGDLTPPATTTTDDSYYLTAAPDFWSTGSPWPSIGFAEASGSIPARDRYVNGIENTYHGSAGCVAPINLGAPEQEPLFAVYPNPASNFIYIESQHPVTRVELFDMAGKVVLQKSAPGKQALFSLSTRQGELAEGLYIIQLAYGTQTYQRLLTINR